MKLNKLFFAFVLTIFVSFPIASAWAEAVFDPNFITQDSDILNYTSMTATQIQSFLEAKGSFLANYSCTDPNGVNYKTADAIYNIAVTNHVNPQFILVLLQKEQGLIEDPAPSQSRLDWATGYGCPDGGGCNERWRGLWKQMNSASLQFRDYLENPHLYKYQAGQTYVFTNPYGTISKEPITVTPINKATAALYNYTPHVYNGNYNFWKLWQRYFMRSDLYTDGSLLQAEGEAGVWLIQNGTKRPFHSRGALISRFDPKKIITVKKDELNKYSTGAPIKFPQYAIVRAPDKKLYLLVNDQRRLFATNDAFKKIGYNPEEIIDATQEEVDAYRSGPDITANDAYPTGALLQDKKTGGVYWVEAGTKAPLVDAMLLKTKFKNKKIIKSNAETLAKYKTVDPVRLNDGELVKRQDGFTIYISSGTALRPVASAQDFETLGYKWSNLIIINDKLFGLYTIGEAIKSIN